MTAVGTKMRKCLREVTYRSPQIKHHVSRAAHGPEESAKYRLHLAIEGTQALLDELKSAQLVLGWRDEDCAVAGKQHTTEAE